MTLPSTTAERREEARLERRERQMSVQISSDLYVDLQALAGMELRSLSDVVYWLLVDGGGRARGWGVWWPTSFTEIRGPDVWREKPGGVESPGFFRAWGGLTICLGRGGGQRLASMGLPGRGEA